MSTKPLSGPIQKTCDLFSSLAGHEMLGLTPGEIAQLIKVSPSWVSINLPALVPTGFIEQVPGTNRWRLGVQFVRISTTVSTNMNETRRRFEETSARYSVPVNPI